MTAPLALEGQPVGPLRKHFPPTPKERREITVTTPLLRTSERISFKRCPQQWKWSWRDGLTPKYPKADARWFGTGIHLALQERYKHVGTKRGSDVLKVWRDYVKDEQAVIFGENFDVDKTDYVDAAQLGETMLGDYLDFYGTDDKWYVLAAEQSFEIPMPRPEGWPRAGEPLVTYAGTFDIVALNQDTEDSLWLWDHKTAKAIQTHHLSLDDQAGSYWAVAADVLAAQGLIKPGMKLDGILYNFLRKAKGDERPTNALGEALNQDGTVSKRQPTPVFVREEVWRTRPERARQIRKIQDEALIMDGVRRRTLPIIKNPTKDCAFMCDFFQLCELHEQGSDWREFRDLSFTKRDPYAAHRESTED